MSIMFGKFIITVLFIIFCGSLGGCICKGDSAIRRTGDAGQALKSGPTGTITAAEVRPPTLVSGTILLEDHVTPISGVHVVLKMKMQETVVSSAYTDHIGNFSLPGPFPHNDYTIEIDSPEYVGSKTILVEPNRDNWFEIIVRKR